MAINYKPRGDFVLFRVTKRDKVFGIAMPQQSEQSVERTIVAFGPDVKDLQVGDKVLVCGTIGESVIALPNEKDLLLTRQSNVFLVMEEVKDEH